MSLENDRLFVLHLVLLVSLYLSLLFLLPSLSASIAYGDLHAPPPKSDPPGPSARLTPVSCAMADPRWKSLIRELFPDPTHSRSSTAGRITPPVYSQAFVIDLIEKNVWPWYFPLQQLHPLPDIDSWIEELPVSNPSLDSRFEELAALFPDDISLKVIRLVADRLMP